MKKAKTREWGPGLHRALIERSRDIHTVLDRDGIVVYQSPSVTEVLGWEAQEMLGFPGFGLIHPEDRPRIEADHAALVAGEAQLLRSRLRLQAKDGRWVHLDSIARNELDDPEILGILIVSRDVSVQVEADRALKEREHLLRTVEGHPCIVLWALDKDGIITVSEGAGLARLGLDEGQTVGANVFDLYIELPHVLGFLRRALAGETLDYSVIVPGAQGMLTVDNRLRPQFSDTGQVVGVTAITFDVTEREILEGELRRAKTMETIGMLAGGVAHDFNNLLTAIVGFASAAKRTVSDERNDYLDQVVAAAHRGGDIVGQLLSFARKDEIRPETVDLLRLLENSLPLYRQVLGDSIELSLEVAAGSRFLIEIDPSKLEQIFLNLVANARDAMSEGGSLNIRLRHIDNPDTHYCVCIDVEDSGQGMTAETAESAFEPFYSTKEGGTGLGLATTRSIISRAGGIISVASVLGKGTTFQLFFPCSDKELPEEIEQTPEPTTAGPGCLLLIDDNAAVLRSTAVELEFFGYEVRVAQSGDAGYELFMRERDDIDMVITDMIMPGMKGDELAKRIREVDGEIPILCVSGHHEHSTLLDKLEGVTLLSKPYRDDELSDTVARLLSKRN